MVSNEVSSTVFPGNGDPNAPKILLVDDNPFNLLTCKKILEKIKFEVCTATNGKEACEKLI